MVRAPWLLLACLASPLAAQTPADRLGTLADGLDAVVADLESGQVKTAELRARLADLEALAEAHQTTLATQEAQLAADQAQVRRLEDHDRQTLARADALAAELHQNQALTGWLVPVAIGASALALVEAGLLWAVAR